MYQIDNMSRQAIYEQVAAQIETYVLTGVLKAGDKLPSVRSLSVDLCVNPNTIQRAYTELERAGIIVTAPGRGAFVGEEGLVRLRERRRQMALTELKTLVLSLKLSGLEKDEVLKAVEDAFGEKEQADD